MLGTGQLCEFEVQISSTATLLPLSGFCLANPVSPNRQPGLLRVVGRGSWPRRGTAVPSVLNLEPVLPLASQMLFGKKVRCISYHRLLLEHTGVGRGELSW